jgi:hypothetical protein
MASGHGKPATPVAGMDLNPLLTAVLAPTADHPKRLISVNLSQRRRRLIRRCLQGLSASAQQGLTGGATPHFRLASIGSTGGQRHRRKQREGEDSAPAPSAKT